jgi:DNA-binding PadR family transcriptional regulator
MPQITRETERVLAAFLRYPTKPRYGLEIAREAGLATGTLYPILARLEAAGWLESEWEDIDPVLAGRRARRYYRLTAEGARVARQAIDETGAHLRGVLRPEWGQA